MPMRHPELSWRFFARQHPASFLEDRIDAGVEHGRGLLDIDLSRHHLLGCELHFIHDAFPLGNLWCCPGTLQLLEKRLRVNVAGEFFVSPWCAPWREISAQRMKTNLHGRLGKVFDQTPGCLGML